MVVSLQEDGIQLLVQMGFTATQAKLYLTLNVIGKTDAKNLAKQANVPRQATYRTLGELQQKGVVEKIIALPQEYKAIPLQDGLANMITSKANEYAEMKEKAREFLEKFEAKKEEQPPETEYQISLIDGKETIISKIKTLTENTQSDLCVCQTLQRWLHVNDEISKTVQEALKRGVKYRVVLEKPEGEFSFPKGYKSLLTHPNYELRMVRGKLKINAALYDGKYGCFSFYPSKKVAESPIIVTNHLSLLVGLQDHFENLWRSSEKVEYKLAVN